VSNAGHAAVAGSKPSKKHPERPLACLIWEVLSLQFHEIFHQAPASESLLSVVHALANMVVELAHKTAQWCEG
jgi:hypothetical protein